MNSGASVLKKVMEHALKRVSPIRSNVLKNSVGLILCQVGCKSLQVCSCGIAKFVYNLSDKIEGRVYFNGYLAFGNFCTAVLSDFTMRVRYRKSYLRTLTGLPVNCCDSITELVEGANWSAPFERYN